MEQEQFFYNLFMAQQEQRCAEKKAAKTKQIRDTTLRSVTRIVARTLDYRRVNGFRHSGFVLALRGNNPYSLHKSVQPTKYELVGQSKVVLRIQSKRLICPINPAGDLLKGCCGTNETATCSKQERRSK